MTETLLSGAPRLRRKDLQARYDISEATLHRYIAKGILPQPVRLGGPRWRLADLLAAENAGRPPSAVRLESA